MRFTQFLLPRGDRRAVEFDAPRDVEKLAEELKRAGWSFECEVLSTNEVSFDCCDEETQLAMQVVENGPAVLEAVRNLVVDAHAKWTQLNYPKAEGTRGAWLERAFAGQVVGSDEEGLF